MSKKLYTCEISWAGWGVAEVLADNRDEAWELFKGGDWTDINGIQDDDYQCDLDTIQEEIL